jgi:hypothetical protein
MIRRLPLATVAVATLTLMMMGIRTSLVSEVTLMVTASATTSTRLPVPTSVMTMPTSSPLGTVAVEPLIPTLITMTTPTVPILATAILTRIPTPVLASVAATSPTLTMIMMTGPTVRKNALMTL